MTELIYQGQSYALEGSETVLDCLLRHGAGIPYSCKSGTCQSCLMQAVDGPIPDRAQVGLKPTFKHQGLFLACQCQPDSALTLRSPDDAGCSLTTTIRDKVLLNQNVLRVHLVRPETFTCKPGQYITVINPLGVARSYSVANDPMQDGLIELHVRLIPDGKMSMWLHTNAQRGAPITIRGPAGSCFYSETEGTDYPIILAGTGTGLAPLYGIARDALFNDHQGSITLFHGALTSEDLYLEAELQALDTAHENFHYRPCVLNDSGTPARTGDIKHVVLEHLPDKISDDRLYICGAPEMVNALKTQAFLGGVGSKHIFADPFLPSKA